MREKKGPVLALVRAAALLAAFGLLGQAFAGSGGNAYGHCKDHGQGNKTGHVKCEPPPPTACEDQCVADYLACFDSVGGDPDLADLLCRPVVLECLAACAPTEP